MKSIQKVFFGAVSVLLILSVFGSTSRQVLAATTFTLTTSTTALGAGTPSRAFTLTVQGGSVGSSTATFTLNDASAGGTFYPSNTVTIPANSVSGTTTQFIYMPPAQATGTITVQAVATGGIAGTESLAMPIAPATFFIADTFNGTAGADLASHTPNLGAEWARGWSTGSGTKLLNGSGGAYDSGTGHAAEAYYVPTAGASDEQDVSVTVSNIDTTNGVYDVSSNVPSGNTLVGYRWVMSAGAYTLVRYGGADGTVDLTSAIGSVTNGSTHRLTLATRQLNGQQYLFPISDGYVVGQPVQDGELSSGYDGFIAEIPSNVTASSTSGIDSDFTATNADWSVANEGTFGLTTSTTALGAGTPSEAITLTVNSGGVGGSGASFALSDGSTGGTFFPSSVSIPANSIAGTTTQFVYTPPADASGDITISANAISGLSGSASLTLPIGTASVIVKDLFSGTAETELSTHTPDIGGQWVAEDPNTQTLPLNLYSGGGVYAEGTGHTYNDYYASSVAPSHSNYDIDTDVDVTDISGSAGFSLNLQDLGPSHDGELNGYRLVFGNKGSGSQLNLDRFEDNNAVSLLTDDIPAGDVVGLVHVRASVREINGNQYLLFNVGGVASSPIEDNTFTSGISGFIPEISAGFTTSQASPGIVIENYYMHNTDWSDGPGLQFSGPSSVNLGQTTGSFTVTGQNLTGTVNVTPNDNGAGGTFNPSTVQLTVGTPSATVTYTPSTSGSKTIAISNDAGITDPSSLSLNVIIPPLVVSFPNANIYQSPYTWRSSGSTLIAPTGGAYLKFKVSGTSTLAADVDTTLNNGIPAGEMPTIKVAIAPDTNPTQITSSWVEFPSNDSSSTEISLASGLDPATKYDVTLYMIGGEQSLANGYTSTVFQTKINDLKFDGGATMSAASLSSNTCMFWGDSILESYFGGDSTGAAANTYEGIVDYSQAWPSYVSAQTLGCEYGQTGVGSQGWVNPGQGGYPVFGSSWNQFDSTHTISFATPPTYALIDEGTNDHGQSLSAITTAVESTLTAMRSAFGNTTHIFIITPYNPTFDDSSQNPRLGIIAGFDAYQTNSGGDTNTILVDLGSSAQQYALSPNSLDGIHPDIAAHVQIASLISADIAPDIISVPNVPTSLAATPSVNSVSLSWSAPANDGGSAITDYSIQYRSTGSSTWTTVDPAATATSAVISGNLFANTSYDFQVAAVNTAGTGSYTTPVTVTTQAGTTSSSGGGTYSSSTGSVPVAPILPVTPVQTSGAVLVNDNGTYYLISGSTKLGITDPGILQSYGYTFAEAAPITAAQQALPATSNLLPNDGTLVKTSSDPTVYLVSGGDRYGFASASVFAALGYKFSSVLTVTTRELDQLPVTTALTDSTKAHFPGTNILLDGTVYRIGADGELHAYPSVAVYNSWNVPDDFSNVVPANAEDQTLQVGSMVVART